MSTVTFPFHVLVPPNLKSFAGDRLVKLDATIIGTSLTIQSNDMLNLGRVIVRRPIPRTTCCFHRFRSTLLGGRFYVRLKKTLRPFCLVGTHRNGLLALYKLFPSNSLCYIYIISNCFSYCV